MTITFSEAVTGFDLADLSLKLGGGSNLLTSAQTLTTSDNITWTLGNLSTLTATSGTYVLTLTASGSAIQDAVGNALSADATATWFADTVIPTAAVTAVASPRNSAVTTMTITFSEAVTGFDLADLSLKLGGGSNLLTIAQTLTTSDNITWTLGNLSELTAASGTYVLTLTASGSAIEDSTGNLLAADATTSWSLVRCNLDADGNGSADALTDGILILRYLFDPSGSWNYSDALGSGATRTTREAIKSYLDGGQTTVLDADGNGAADALTDGILILRYLFDPNGAWNYSDALGTAATRTTLDQIKAYLDDFNPAIASSAALAETSTADVSPEDSLSADSPSDVAAAQTGSAAASAGDTSAASDTASVSQVATEDSTVALATVDFAVSSALAGADVAAFAAAEEESPSPAVALATVTAFADAEQAPGTLAVEVPTGLETTEAAGAYPHDAIFARWDASPALDLSAVSRTARRELPDPFADDQFDALAQTAVGRLKTTGSVPSLAPARLRR
jgi:hypothetical protein